MREIFILAFLAVAAFAGLQTYRIQLMENRQLAQEVERGKATVRQLDKAQLQTADLQEKVNEAQARLDETIRNQTRERGRLTAELAGLRNDLDRAAAGRDVSEAACAPHIARIRLVEELFFRCTQRYSSVAGDASKWQAQSRTLNQGWPSTNSK